MLNAKTTNSMVASLSQATTKLSYEDNKVGLRTVVIEFDSYETAVAAYNSRSYKKAMGSLNGTLDFRIIRNAV